MYTKAELELITFDVEDVITTSGGTNNGHMSSDGDPVVIPPGNENAPDPE